MTQRTTIPAREIDQDKDECVGCGAHFVDPCHPECPFETGKFGPADILRAANRRVRNHPAGVGYDIAAAIFAAAVDLVPDRAQVIADEARAALADYLVGQWPPKAEAIRNQVIYRHGLFAQLAEIAVG
jgi:ferredoxin